MEHINSNIDTLLSVTKKQAIVRGSKWDDIILKFEYETVTVPILKREIQKSLISKAHKDFLTRHIAFHYDLDVAALNEAFKEFEMLEDASEAKYNQIIAKVTEESKQRIRHA